VVPARARQAAALGATRSGTVLRPRSTRPRAELWPVVVERLRQVDDALEGTGVRLGVEFLGVKTLYTERPYLFVGSLAEANELFDAVGARQVGLTLDSYHWHAAGDTLDTIRQTPGERIVLLHLNDARDAPRHTLLDADRLVPGEGVIPLTDWLRAVAAVGFDGFAGMEVLGPRLAGLSPAQKAALGVDSLRPLLAAAVGTA
jgi:sugar phosphate isomerase/epimerase